MRELGTLSDFGLGWLDGSGPHSGIVLSTRVRLARNLQGHSFNTRTRDGEREQIFERVRQAADQSSVQGGLTLDLRALSPLSRKVLHERHLVSRELAGLTGDPPSRGAGLLVGPRDALSVMINEEDHLRVQGIVSGLSPAEAYRRVDQLDEELGAQIPFAYHQEYGFLTSCPTNVGTGLRASILIHLPALVLTKEIGRVLQGIGQVGLTFRGLFGEGSEVIGNFFQISNQTTLGKSEEDLIEHLEKIVERVIEYELGARDVLMRDAPMLIEDKIWRAYGLLRFARSLSFEEVMNLLSGVRLGVSMNLLSGLRVYTLNKLMIYTQDAHLEQAAGHALSEPESDLHRATYVRRVLAAEGDVSPDPDTTHRPGS
ncbi:MAG TPA: protein arginine kinase [Longimicrobiales bacterium]|nr:protein arginine kinase [Longimicrobiales bacterium]